MANEDLVGDDLVVADEKLSDRHELFCQTYVSNGRNATKAYIAVGYSENGADSSASRLLANAKIALRISELTAPIMQASALTLENTLKHIAAVAQFDKRKLFYPDGSRIPIHLLDETTAFALSHQTKEDVMPFSKMSALEMSMKYLGGFEKDNAQQRDNLVLQVVLE